MWVHDGPLHKHSVHEWSLRVDLCCSGTLQVGLLWMFYPIFRDCIMKQTSGTYSSPTFSHSYKRLDDGNACFAMTIDQNCKRATTETQTVAWIIQTVRRLAVVKWWIRTAYGTETMYPQSHLIIQSDKMWVCDGVCTKVLRCRSCSPLSCSHIQVWKHTKHMLGEGFNISPAVFFTSYELLIRQRLEHRKWWVSI